MRKVLLSPLRLAVGWGLAPRLIGWVGVTMLVLLRLTVGMHFFSEGVDKFESKGSWSAVPFFSAARGPFESEFHSLVWDHDGQLRLDRDRMMLEWAKYRDRIEKHYGFDEQQKLAAQENYAKAVEQYDYVIELNRNDIEEYQLGRDRVDALAVDPVRREVASLAGQREEIRREWIAKVSPVLKQIDSVSDNYEIAQNSLATEEQADAKMALALNLPATGFIDTSLIDGIVPYFDTTVGLCLLLGLFTPIAALAAAGFLGSVFLSQFPPQTGPNSTYYPLVEGMACLVLAGMGAGRFAGFDFFLHLIVRKVWGPPTIEE